LKLVHIIKGKYMKPSYPYVKGSIKEAHGALQWRMTYPPLQCPRRFCNRLTCDIECPSYPHIRVKYEDYVFAEEDLRWLRLAGKVRTS
jgi:hypothetical protein